MGGVAARRRVTFVVPFREGGKSRLPPTVRREAALAMLADVLGAACGLGQVLVVTDDPDATQLACEAGAVVVADPDAGQGAAVVAALAALDGPCAVVNADLPCVTAAELETLLAVARSGGFGLVEADDGTTNALALPTAAAFAALYGAGSAARFRAHAVSLGLRVADLMLPGLISDVDSLDDLERIAERAGPATRALLVGVAP